MKGFFVFWNNTNQENIDKNFDFLKPLKEMAAATKETVDYSKYCAIRIGKARCWFKNYLYHRDGDAPAWIHDNGTMLWYVEGMQHRIGGPAVVHKSGDQWWVDGKQYPNGDDYNYKKACDDYLKKHGVAVPGRLTKRANPN